MHEGGKTVIHFRATGDAVDIARGMKAAFNVTSTPFPQKPASNAKSPLPSAEMGKILGAKPSVGADDVVNFNVPRAEKIRLGGVAVNPYLNIAAPIAFQPYGGGQNAAAVPDFAMLAHEINDVMKVMRQQGWDIGCLIQPGNGRASAIVLLTPVQDRQRTGPRPGDSQGAGSYEF